MSESFLPTHVIPARGARAWADPDGTVAPVARFDGGVAVQVLESKADWSRVVSADGTTGWVDARHLLDAEPAHPESESNTNTVSAPVAEISPVAQVAEVAEVSPVAEPTGASGGIDIRGVSIVPLVGSAVIVLGSFLSWWSVGDVSLTAWDIPLEFVITGNASDGLKTGPVLLVLAIMLALPALIGRPFPPAVGMVVGAVAFSVAALTLARGIGDDPSLYPAFGLLMSLGGAALAVADSAPFWNLRMPAVPR